MFNVPDVRHVCFSVYWLMKFGLVMVQFKNSVSNRPSRNRDLTRRRIPKSRTVPGAEVGGRRHLLAKTHLILYQPSKYSASSSAIIAQVPQSVHCSFVYIRYSLSMSFAQETNSIKTFTFFRLATLCFNKVILAVRLCWDHSYVIAPSNHCPECNHVYVVSYCINDTPLYLLTPQCDGA